MSANDHPYSDIQRDLDGQNGAEPAVRAAAHEIGCVDGASQATTRRFAVVLDDDAAVELDELVTCVQRLPDGSGDVTHYGIVVEQRGVIEGAEMPSDTRHIARERTMPGQTVRAVDVQVLRTMPERWVAPEPGAAVHRALGAEREAALFVDEMRGRVCRWAWTNQASLSRWTSRSSMESRGGTCRFPESQAWRRRRRSRCSLCT